MDRLVYRFRKRLTYEPFSKPLRPILSVIPAPYQVRGKLQPESSEFKMFWTPVFTRVTVMEPRERVSIVNTLMKRYTRMWILHFH